MEKLKCASIKKIYEIISKKKQYLTFMVLFDIVRKTSELRLQKILCTYGSPNTTISLLFSNLGEEPLNVAYEAYSK